MQVRRCEIRAELRQALKRAEEDEETVERLQMKLVEAWEDARFYEKKIETLSRQVQELKERNESLERQLRRERARRPSVVHQDETMTV